MPRFKKGDIVFSLFTGRRGEIIKYEGVYTGQHSYTVQWVGEEFKSNYGDDDLAFENDPLLIQIQKWKAEMIDKGFNSIIVGIQDMKVWTCVFFNGHENYSVARQSKANTRWKYYWSLPSV